MLEFSFFSIFDKTKREGQTHSFASSHFLKSGRAPMPRLLSLCCVFVDHDYDHCIFCPSHYSFWLPLWQLQIVLRVSYRLQYTNATLVCVCKEPIIDIRQICMVAFYSKIMKNHLRYNYTLDIFIFAKLICICSLILLRYSHIVFYRLCNWLVVL